jgi:hypothetical protein
MAFSVPVFPIFCDIYSGPWNSKALRLSAVPCNLAWSKRVNTGLQAGTTPSSSASQSFMTLLLPALTDIRDGAGLVGAEGDIVEVIPGSGRWYGVICVDDLGKGFANEHRGAIIVKVYEKISPTQFPGLTWPFPIP